MLASSYHQQQLPASQQQPPTTVSPTSTTLNPPPDAQQPPPQPQPQPPGTFQTLRLRDEQTPVVTPQPAPRTSRKRKSTPTTGQEPPAMPPPPPPGMHPPPPPPPGMMSGHFLPHIPPPPHGYQYVPGDYTPGGMPPPPPPPQQVSPSDQAAQSQLSANAGRMLSTSKRAEQNRKAQRAFRERRDQHVKALESRSQLLDAALASADEANRRWEDCRALVDQLRIENAALRAALQQAQMANGQAPSLPPPPSGLEALPPKQDAPKALEAHAEGAGAAGTAGEERDVVESASATAS